MICIIVNWYDKHWEVAFPIKSLAVDGKNISIKIMTHNSNFMFNLKENLEQRRLK